MEKIVISFGEILWDCFPDGTKTLGGAPLNFAYYCKICGLTPYVVSALGADDYGQAAADRISKLGLDLRFIQRKEFLPTGKTIVYSNGSEVSYDIQRGCAWEKISYDKLLGEYVGKAAIIAYGSLAQEGAESAHTLYKILSDCPKDTLRIFDANLRGDFYSKDRIVESLEFADILKLNEFEIGVFKEYFGLKTLDDNSAAEKILKIFRLKYLILTLGANGSLILGKDFSIRQEAVKTNIVDTVGAGDSFTATFVSKIANGDSPLKAAKAAAAMSAKVCSIRGAFLSK